MEKILYFGRTVGSTGICIKELAPTIHSRIPPRIRADRTVKEALLSTLWATDIGPDMEAGALNENLRIWPRITDAQIHEDSADEVRWSWEEDGHFSV